MTPLFEPVLIEVRNATAATGDGNNTYLMAPAGTPACLIDAGIGDAVHLDRLADQLRLRQSSLADVLVTHGHVDHSSGAPALASRFGPLRFSKHRSPSLDLDGVEWRHVEDGARLQVAGTELVALHTPGHAPDHLAFWHESSRTVFTGDLVHGLTSVAIIYSRGGSLTAYLASLERLLTLEPARLLPGHGPAIDDPPRVLRTTIAHRRMREEQVRAAVAAGVDTVQSITDSIYHGLTRGLMGLARENVRAHLEKLRIDGDVAVDRDRWRLV